MKDENRTHWAVLAGARFVLSVIVLLCHLSIVARGLISNFAEQFNAFSAVIAFFLISGYSIHLSILRDGRGYFARRFWRIYPIYVASLLLSIVLIFTIKLTAGVSHRARCLAGFVRVSLHRIAWIFGFRNSWRNGVVADQFAPIQLVAALWNSPQFPGRL